MANMFSGKIQKEIPKALTDCTKQDPTVSNLHAWAERLETLGKALFIIIIVIGIISTFVDGVTTYEYLEAIDPFGRDRQQLADAGIEIPNVFDVVVSSIIRWSLYAVLEYCAYHVFALIISALASITQNTIITANVSLYDAYQKYIAPTTTTEEAPPKMWVCKSCGTQNKDDYGQCKKCGKYRSS